MNLYVSDTHALFWYLTANSKLGPNARAAFLEADQGNAIIYVPSILLAELYFLNAKYGHPINFVETYERLAGAAQFRFVSFRAEDVLHFDRLTSIPEMHDRIIAAAAHALNAACLTRDPMITNNPQVRSVW